MNAGEGVDLLALKSIKGSFIQRETRGLHFKHRLLDVTNYLIFVLVLHCLRSGGTSVKM